MKRIRRYLYSALVETGTPGAFAGLYVAASLFGNFFGFLYNSYLTRVLSVETFGLVSLFGSLLYIAQIGLSALMRTVTHRTAYLSGFHGSVPGRFWAVVRSRVFLVGSLLALAWVVAIPFLKELFGLSDTVLLVAFTPIWVVGYLSAVDGGFLHGNTKFGLTAAILVVEALVKLAITVVLVTSGFSHWAYVAIPLSLAAAQFMNFSLARMVARTGLTMKVGDLTFPKRFFSVSVISKLAAISFLSLDVILAKRFLTPTAAGHYAMLSLVGKMIYFFGSLSGTFINPLVSRSEGAGGKDSGKIFTKIFVGTVTTTTVAYVGLGIFGYLTVPFLYGLQTLSILPYLPLYCLGMGCFTLADTISSYHHVRKEYVFPLFGFVIALMELALLSLSHGNTETFVQIMAGVGVAHLAVMVMLHASQGVINSIGRNIGDFVGLFVPYEPKKRVKPRNLRILIFNWRDTSHAWAGGAETYIHELAKRWVSSGHRVTVFCGNDSRHARNQVVDNVQIVRRGGFYTVYLWAFLYYTFRFRGNYDVVIDSVNGIPFFTPLYVRVPNVLLIYHIHQEVFRKHLIFPFSMLAMWLESRLMPIVYRHRPIVTISPSSKEEIVKVCKCDPDHVAIVHPGVDPTQYGVQKKTSHPSMLYLGRLKPYKRIDVAIDAFAKVHKAFARAKFTIAGAGESAAELGKLVQTHRLGASVTFVGKVSEGEKAKLMATHWVMVQPSSVEGWGITVVEAGASGTPVIASNVAGLRDSVLHEKTGLLVMPGSGPALTNALQKVFSDPALRKTMSREARVWSSNFHWDNSADTFMRVLTSELFVGEDRPIPSGLVAAER